MKKHLILFCLVGLVATVCAEEPIKLKTVRIDYGNIKGKTVINLGKLDGADINLYSLPKIQLLPVQVNLSSDTFPVNSMLQQCYEVYFFSSDDSLIFSLGQKSQKNRLEEAVIPGDTCYLSMLSLDMLSIKAYLEENGVATDKIAYWKLIAGFCYSDMEGDYSTKKFYSGSDTSVFRVPCGNAAAQAAVKLKTVHTNYGVHNGASFSVIGDLDGAVINPDSVPMLATEMYIVNTGNDTFKGTDKFRQVIIFYAYSADGGLLIEPDFNESNTYPFVNPFLPGDTACYGTMGFRFSDIRATVGENTWKKISYWKIVTGISYTSVDGTYPDAVFFASADTCTFRITTSGVGIASVSENIIGCDVFPNPASDRISVECEAEMRRVTLCNALGQQVLHVTPNAPQAELSVSGLPRGLYLLHVQTANGSAVRKVVVE